MADEGRPMSTAALANREETPREPDRQPDAPADSQDWEIGSPDGSPAASRATAGGATTEKTQLLAAKEAEDFQNRWDETQRGFVDEPRTSVQQGDQLVAELMQLLAKGFADERRSLEQQWDRGEEVSTEDLRVALQRYRSFFQRLLAV